MKHEKAKGKPLSTNEVIQKKFAGIDSKNDLVFGKGDDVVGKLGIRNGLVAFEGNAEKSAIILFGYLKAMWKNELRKIKKI